MIVMPLQTDSLATIPMKITQKSQRTEAWSKDSLSRLRALLKENTSNEIGNPNMIENILLN